MRVSVRVILTVLGSAFAVYLAVRGLVWTAGPVPRPVVAVAAVALYLCAAGLSIFHGVAPETATAADQVGFLAAGEQGPPPLSAWVCVLALATAAIVPSAIAVAMDPVGRMATYGTWYIGAIGLLMTIVMVRRRTWAAWAGLVILAVSAMLWLGVLQALALGLIGSAMWVLAAQLLVLSMDRASRDAARLAQLQQAASAWRAAQVGRQRERRVQVQRALAVAGPILSRAIEQGGALDARERAEARIAEGQLRDELRGARLLDDGVRAELDAARRRGAAVLLLDEGGLDGLDETQLAAVRSQLAAAVHEAGSARLYIRASTDPRVAVTIVGRSAAGAGLSDEDSVDLWHEIPRPD